MSRRTRGLLGLVFAAAIVAVPVASAGPAVEELAEGTTSSWTPATHANAPVTVMVQVAGDPVALVEANAGRKLGKSEKAKVAADLEARQDGLKPALQRLGATILDDYQYAYNGIKIQVSASKAAAIEALPGVVALREIQLMEPDHTNSVPLIGAPAVWNGPGGFRGENVKIAIIDTGIDYTHATFGGPGTVAAYEAANAADTLAPPPTLMGPAAPKVKGGIDLVGDAYNASAAAGSPALTPNPDPNPLDCNGHGTHVAGSAAGFGVRPDGSTYPGPFDPTTYTANTFRIGPGVAPRADLYAVRVFGCAGSTNVTVDAIEWAVANDMDVINMSLGSAFGSADDPSAAAATNAAKAGVIVVTSAGNSGAAQYIGGSPGTSTGVISVAANDANPGFPGATIALPSGTIQAINANGADFSPMSLEVKVLRTSTGAVSLGCDPAEYVSQGVAGKLVVTVRGTCARVARAIYGQKAGAAAVVMVDTSANLPPFEGPITSNPDTGEQYTVTIPFLGVRGLLSNPASDGAKLVAADGATVAVSPAVLANPNFTGFASFTSGGPRRNDSWLKPDITAPGVSILSAGNGTGSGALINSGTSMAAPHVAGVAALTRQAHPTWSVEDIKAAIVNTGDPSGVLNFRISRGGSGMVNPQGSTRTMVVAVADELTASLSYGFEELRNDYRKQKKLEIRNHGDAPATFTLSALLPQGSPHSVSVRPDTVTVPAGGQVNVHVELIVPAATVGDASAFREVAGIVRLTPVAGSNNGVVLNVPYLLVPRALSDVKTTLRGQPTKARPTTEAVVRNSAGAAVSGSADFYNWGLDDKKDTSVASNDIRAVGVQSFASPTAQDPDRRLLVFAVNTYDRWSNASEVEFDIPVDVDNDGTWDYTVVGADQGLLQTGSFSGNMVTAIFSTRSPGGTLVFNATAPHDSSTILLPMRTSNFCRTGEPCMSKTGNATFTYGAATFALRFGSTTDTVDGVAKYSPWAPTLSDGMFVGPLAPGETESVPVTLNPASAAVAPSLGLMVVTHDNKNGRDEADLIRVPAAGR
jgi:subtilisin family serine protease